VLWARRLRSVSGEHRAADKNRAVIPDLNADLVARPAQNNVRSIIGTHSTCWIVSTRWNRCGEDVRSRR
jgi:hypothetical protein